MYAEISSFSDPLPGAGLPLPARGISLENLINPFAPGRSSRPEAGNNPSRFHDTAPHPSPGTPGGALPRASRPGR